MAIRKIQILSPKHRPPQKITLHTTCRNPRTNHNTIQYQTSYFSSPVKCSTLVNNYYSPFQQDSIFGSKGTAFSHKWIGIGYAHPHNQENIQKPSIGHTSPQKKTKTQSPSSPYQTKNGPQMTHHTKPHLMIHMSSYISYLTA
jgi:hypothetical protein